MKIQHSEANYTKQQARQILRTWLHENPIQKVDSVYQGPINKRNTYLRALVTCSTRRYQLHVQWEKTPQRKEIIQLKLELLP